MRATAPRYTAEFRSDAVELLKRTDRSFRQVSEDLGVSLWSLRSWYKQDQMAKRSKKASQVARAAPPATETVEQKLLRLERELERVLKENEQLKEDREILKKAAAFFAKENE
jgi:transposase